MTFSNFLFNAINSNLVATWGIIGTIEITLITALITISYSEFTKRKERILIFKNTFTNFIVELEKSSEINVYIPDETIHLTGIAPNIAKIMGATSIREKIINDESIKHKTAIVSFRQYLKGKCLNRFNTKTIEYENKIKEYKNTLSKIYTVSDNVMKEIIADDIRIKKDLRNLITQIFEIVDKH